ncbi:MAG: HypC/HybG/HupF family hydrogenase formation chaperone [Candidatus Binatia bacterium]
MCLGIPGRITTIFEEEGIRMGKVDFGGVFRRVCLAYLPDAQEGDYTIVHAGFAISLVDEAEAQRTLALLDEMETSTAPEDS